MTNTILLFCTTFSLVFLLGLQSQFVRDKQVLASITTSSTISVMQIFLYKAVSHDTSTDEDIAYVMGGTCGLAASIYFHSFLMKYVFKGKK